MSFSTFNILRKMLAKRKPKLNTSTIFNDILWIIFRVLSIVGILIFFVTFSTGINYGTTPINVKMDFQRDSLSADNLAAALTMLIEEINKVSENIEADENGNSIMPYGLQDLNRKLNIAYRNMLLEYNLFYRINIRVKPTLTTTILPRLGISGFYSPITGEAIIDRNLSDSRKPFTASHEMAHAMGIMREDEANFIAFLACLYSDDDYIKYSGLSRIIDYIGGELVMTDWEKYQEIMENINEIVMRDRELDVKVFFRNLDRQLSRTVRQVQSTFWDSLGLKAETSSYSLVTELAVQYLLTIHKT
jgi:hypothetical protein